LPLNSGRAENRSRHVPLLLHATPTSPSSSALLFSPRLCANRTQKWPSHKKRSQFIRWQACFTSQPISNLHLPFSELQPSPKPNSLAPSSEAPTPPTNPLPDLKNTSDDAIPAYLNSLKFKQSHTLSDTRLALGYTAFAICAATFYWDYKLGFDSTKYYTAAAVAIYTILNGILTFWIFYVEAGTVYVGRSPCGSTIRISTKTEKHVPIYNLAITVTGKEGKEGKEIKLKKPFTGWFDKSGAFHSLPFQQMFASNVSLIGEADPGKVVEKKKQTVTIDDGKSMDEKWASLLAESEAGEEVVIGASTTAPGKSAKKRGKKA
jgi:signal peptidase complex subunit 2